MKNATHQGLKNSWKRNQKCYTSPTSVGIDFFSRCNHRHAKHSENTLKINRKSAPRRFNCTDFQIDPQNARDCNLTPPVKIPEILPKKQSALHLLSSLHEFSNYFKQTHENAITLNEITAPRIIFSWLFFSVITNESRNKRF